MFKIVERRYWFFLLSALILVPGLVSLAVKGLPRAIDFRGGAIYVVAFAEPEGVSEEGVRQAYASAGIPDAHVVLGEDPVTGELRYQIRSSEVSWSLTTRTPIS